MFPSSNRSPRTLLCLAAGVLLVPGWGCGGNPFGIRGQEGPLLEQVNATELRSGCYCEIDMVKPPLVSEDSFDCFKGTVKEVNQDEIVLTGVLEESYLDYGTSSHRRQPTQQKRDLVRVPRTGIDAIWALPLTKDEPATARTSNLSTPRLPSNGAPPTPPPQAPPWTPGGEPAGPPVANRSSIPLPDTPAHFDAP